MSKHNIITLLANVLIFSIWLAACRGVTPTVMTQATATPPRVETSAAGITTQPTSTSEKPTEPTQVVEEPPAATATPTEAAQPTPTPVQETTAPTPTTVPTQSDCIDQATFVKDVTIPDGQLFEPNVNFTKTWRVVNSGTCTWGDGYKLVYAGGDIMNGGLVNPIQRVEPGETADISIELTAPNRFGQKIGHWLFENAAGEQFGTGLPAIGQLWVLINVSSPSSGANPTPSGGNGCAIQRNSAYENEILALINQARSANGLNSVTINAQLSAAALSHSTDMACNDFVDHVGSDGSTWTSRVAAQGYANAASTRENIYVGDPAFGGTAQGAFDWWMNSQVHRDNILYTQIQEIGIAYVYLPGSSYGGYYTLVLAWP